MCQMCDEYEAELRRMGIVETPKLRETRRPAPRPDDNRKPEATTAEPLHAGARP